MAVNVKHVCLNGYANAVTGPVPKDEILIIHVHATSFDGTATYDTVMTDASSSNKNDSSNDGKGRDDHDNIVMIMLICVRLH